MYTTEDIDFLKNIIVETINPEKVILFGSYAYGTPDEKSDIDLLGIVSDNELSFEESIELASKVRAAYRSIEKDHYISFDFGVSTWKDVEYLYDDRDSCIYDVMRKGKVLYDRSKQESSSVR
ncbi:MAG: nucleotidyltransferase domain-containing protein [Eubacteriales bacterium]|nr:nucleotidyltransferase domain-containing protein [Eubacteriales bacterium]